MHPLEQNLEDAPPESLAGFRGRAPGKGTGKGVERGRGEGVGRDGG